MKHILLILLLFYCFEFSILAQPECSKGLVPRQVGTRWRCLPDAVETKNSLSMVQIISGIAVITASFLGYVVYLGVSSQKRITQGKK